MILENKMVKPESRGTLIKFMQLMVSHHLSRSSLGILGIRFVIATRSTNDTRGFSCGLWVLLHSISVRMETGESQMAFTTTCVSDFITLMHEAIAAASCLFGALAWFWRSRQKNRKPRRS
ncbi:putative thiol oxidase [Helianthus annuus]|uniref:Sulfhydryl oxidase n=1 Tax=Helianthus annuus TaxID=4232 RepID=A0A9K3P0U3_HELAN|nr:putative thiol oxidase [Helianthus annuus]KAJ0616895.1 putative thiol oxidase [Helianthus annuus]